MYNVIIVHDNTKDKNYYYSYVEEKGNIECEDLPPYQDTNKARACYWDNKNWIYDAEKYAEIIASQERMKVEVATAQAVAAAVPSNEELAEAVIEIGNSINDIMEAMAELGTLTSKKGGKA